MYLKENGRMEKYKTITNSLCLESYNHNNNDDEKGAWCAALLYIDGLLFCP